MNYVEIIGRKGHSSLLTKTGDTYQEFRFKLYDGTMNAVSLSGKSVEVVIANNSGNVYNKTAAILSEQGTISIKFEDDEYLFDGNYDLEIHVKHSNSRNEIFPSDSYLQMKVLENLNNRIDSSENRTILFDIINRAEKAIADAKQSTQNVTIQIADAKAATDSANLAASKANEATDGANAAKEETESATSKANTAATQADVARDDAKAATERANIATEGANKAATDINQKIEQMDDLIADTTVVKNETVQTINEANIAINKTQKAIEDAVDATAQANQAVADVAKAKDDAEIATTKATKAIEDAELSIDMTNQARDNANIATERANTAADEAIEATEQANAASSTVNDVIDTANIAISSANAIADDFAFLDEYSPAIDYKKRNMVKFEGSTYMAKKDNIGIIPSSDSSVWGLAAQRGLDGKGSIITVNNLSPDLTGNLTIGFSDVGASPEDHEHMIDQIDGLQAELDNAKTYVDENIAKISDALGNDPNFSETIETKISKKVDKVIGKDLSTEDFTTEEKDKLSNLEENANNYIHPLTHPASMIVQDPDHRMLSDEKIAELESKSGGVHKHSISDINGMQEALDSKETQDGAQIKADNAEANAKDYTDLQISEIGSGIVQQDTPPEGIEEGRLWIDTSDNTFQGTAFEEFNIIRDNLDNHLIDHDVHITNEDRYKLDNAETQVGAQTKADNAEQSAKSYTDIELEKKVDKEDGKGLSSEDFTTEEKDKLFNIDENANNYIHPDTHAATMIDGLSAVATSGDYNDLINLPLFTSSVESVNGKVGVVDIDKYDIGLSNVTDDEQATKVEFDTHSSNDDIHVSLEKKVEWDSKETIVGSQEKADTAEVNAKTYTDSKVSDFNVFEAQEEFAASEGQTVFNLVGSYEVGKNRLSVFVGGVQQYAPNNFTETSENSFTLVESVPSSITVVAKYYKALPVSENVVTSVNDELPDINGNISLTPESIGAETPEGAKAKALQALNDAKLYVDENTSSISGLYRELSYLKLKQQASDRINGGVTFADDMNLNRFGFTLNGLESQNIKIRNGKLLMIEDVEAPRSVVDEVVVNQAYSTAGNGGRKIVRLDNGWIVVAAKITNYIHLYVDKLDGNGFTQMCFIYVNTLGNGDVALVSRGNIVYLIHGSANRTINSYVIDATTVTNINIQSNQLYIPRTIVSNESELGNVSLAIDPTNGHLHAAWASKNATYPSGFNIRYAKSADEGATWSTVEQVTTMNTSGWDSTNLSVVVLNNKPIITYARKEVSNSVNTIAAQVREGSGWSYKSVYTGGGNYAQSNPSAVVDKDGVIHVAWQGKDSTDIADYIRYSKSSDGGVNWSPMQKLQPGTNTSISVNSQGHLFITYQDNGVTEFIKSVNDASSWSDQIIIGTGTNPATLDDNTLNFTTPLTARMGANNVLFSGNWIAIVEEPRTTAKAVYDIPSTDFVGAFVEKIGDISLQAYINNKLMDSELKGNEYQFEKNLSSKTPIKLRLELSRKDVSGAENDAVARILGGRS